MDADAKVRCKVLSGVVEPDRNTWNFLTARHLPFNHCLRSLNPRFESLKYPYSFANDVQLTVDGLQVIVNQTSLRLGQTVNVTRVS